MVLVVGGGLSVYTAVHVVPVDPPVGARSGARKTIPPFRFEAHVLLEFRSQQESEMLRFPTSSSSPSNMVLSLAPAPITIPKPLLACRRESAGEAQQDKKSVRGEGSFPTRARNDLKLSDPRTKNSSICQRISAPFFTSMSEL